MQFRHSDNSIAATTATLWCEIAVTNTDICIIFRHEKAELIIC